MKRLLALICTVMAAMTTVQAQDIYVGQYNVRNDNEKDAAKGNGWERRGKVICDIINYENFDIFGAQEVKKNQLDDMAGLLDRYAHIGVGRDDGKTGGEYAPIFYRKDRISCLKSGTFWLSETPDVPGSKGWDAKYPRICTWGFFKDLKTGRKFCMFNLHMDHKGIEARREGARLVLSKIKEICPDLPYILTGDFNVDQKNEIYGIITGSGLLMDSYETAERRFAATGSMNNFNPDSWTDSRIDHIFISPDLTAEDFGLKTYTYWTPSEKACGDEGAQGNGTGLIRRTPSDHHPIGAHLSFASDGKTRKGRR